MKQKLSKTNKPENQKIRFSPTAPKFGRVLLVDDFNSCVLVVPEVFGIQEHIMLYQGRFHEYQL